MAKDQGEYYGVTDYEKKRVIISMLPFLSVKEIAGVMGICEWHVVHLIPYGGFPELKKR